MSFFPELVVSRHDDYTSSAWTLEPGSPQRGGASCDFTNRILRVPLRDDAASRAVRMHELVHVRVSPHRPVSQDLVVDIEPRALECAEEFRVNTLLKRLGFATDLLCDGSEKPGARRLAERSEWGEAVCFLLAVLGTGAERDFLSGIRAGRPAWVAPLRALGKRAVEIVRSGDTNDVASTTCTVAATPDGYANFTIPVARLLTQSMHVVAPEDAEALKKFRRSLQPGARRPPSGKSATLVLDTTLPLVSQGRRNIARRQKPSVAGATLRYPSRLLTDPHARAFASKQRVQGGVVVIDQSGSMDIDADCFANLLRRAPNATVIGYSHRPGTHGSIPNAWVLANHAAVVTQIPSGNIGNGVDREVLRWAVRQSHGTEPIVWVTDGQVTDSNDHPCDSLSLDCALLVRHHRITMVRRLEDVSFARGTQTNRFEEFGRVGRKLRELRIPTNSK